MLFYFDRFEELRSSMGITKKFIAEALDRKETICQAWKNGKSEPNDKQIKIVADILRTTPAYLRGETDYPFQSKAEGLNSPGVTDDFVRYPVLGDVAAGYDHICYEDWTGETADIPRSWLKGRDREDYFVLRVSGDSMYPQYQNGDVVFVLRQATMDRSGQIGVVVYDDDKATLKRVEYVMGEDWMKLSPINPQFPPVTITNESLEHCRVLGIPKMLIREIRD